MASGEFLVSMCDLEGPRVVSRVTANQRDRLSEEQSPAHPLQILVSRSLVAGPELTLFRSIKWKGQATLKRGRSLDLV